jgi:hypothetical protein
MSRPSGALRRHRSTSGGAALASIAVIVALWVVRVGIHLPGGHAGSTSRVFADSSRALGIAALVLAGAALPVGLTVGRRMIRGRSSLLYVS